MTSSDQNPGQDNPKDRLEQIKREEQEDASQYYAQGGSGEKGTTEEDFNQPIPPVESEEEEMSLLKAVAFLGFGMAALAIIFILFFIRDLGNKVGDVDAAVHTLEERFGPLKKDVEAGFAKVNEDVGQLQDKFSGYEKMIAVMELKRAKVAIQEVTANTTPELQAKSAQVVAHIDSLLTDLGAGEAGAAPVILAPALLEPVPAPAPGVEAAPPAEPVMEEPAPAEPPAPATAEPAPGVIQLKSEKEEPAEPDDDKPEEGGSDGGDDDDEDDEEDDEEDDDKEK